MSDFYPQSYIPLIVSTNFFFSPVVVFIHGGGWRRGDKNNHPLWGVARAGRAFAKAGYVTVVPSYRLSRVGLIPTLTLSVFYTAVLGALITAVVAFPLSLLFDFSLGKVSLLLLGLLFIGFTTWLQYLELNAGDAQHPDHADDVAATIRWTLDNVHQYGGDRTKIFLAGHSAGGHLISLLTLDRSYIREAGVHESEFDECVRGVVSISGVYNISRLYNYKIAGMPLARWSFVAPSFSQRQHEVASPTAKRKKVPQKFYLIVAEKDHPPLKEDFKELCQNFDNLGIQYDSLEIPKKNHRTVMFDIDTSKDATTENVIAWLNKTVASLKD